MKRSKVCQEQGYVYLAWTLLLASLKRPSSLITAVLRQGISAQKPDLGSGTQNSGRRTVLLKGRYG